MDKKQKKMLLRILASGALLILVSLLPLSGPVRLSREYPIR